MATDRIEIGAVFSGPKGEMRKGADLTCAANSPRAKQYRKDSNERSPTRNAYKKRTRQYAILTKERNSVAIGS
jgi:hypothetical protein